MIADLIIKARPRRTTEAAMQFDIAEALDRSGMSFDREVILTAKDRIDFLVGDVGIECKIDGGVGEILGQLLRYAESPRVASLILVSSRVKHAIGWPQLVGGKPLTVVILRGLA